MTSSLISALLLRPNCDLPVPIRGRRDGLNEGLSRSVSESRGETGNAIDGDIGIEPALQRVLRVYSSDLLVVIRASLEVMSLWYSRGKMSDQLSKYTMG